MLKDMEGNVIIPTSNDNGRTLILGKSGKGKTYLIDRIVEEDYEVGKSTLIVDQSGSYTEKELKRAGFMYLDHIQEYDITEKPLCLLVNCPDAEVMSDWIIDGIVSNFKVENSYTQRNILSESVREVIQTKGVFNFSELYTSIKRYILNERAQFPNTNFDLIRQAELLLRKLKSTQKLEYLTIDYSAAEVINIEPMITVFQVSNLECDLRIKVVLFLLTIIFEECKYKGNNPSYDVMVLDEFQDYPIKESVINEFLRKGRKFQIEMIMSTQYITDLRKSDKNALEQSDHLYYFGPVAEDVRDIAKFMEVKSQRMISKAKWEQLLLNMERGQVLFVGKYHLDGRRREIEKPIKVMVHKRYQVQQAEYICIETKQE